MEIPQFDQGLYDLGNQVYAWLVPNGAWGESNAGLMVGDTSCLLIDTQWDVQLTRFMLKAMDGMRSQVPIKKVINTHADGDHTWGNQLLPEADIITSEKCAAEMRSLKPASMVMFGLLGRILTAAGKSTRVGKVGHWFQSMVKPYNFSEVKIFLPTQTFNGEISLAINGRTVRLLEVGPAHTHGDILVHITDSGILFAGDILFIESTPVMWAGPVENWLRALDLILGMDIDIIIPGHGPATDKDGVKAVKAYWEYLAVRVPEFYKRGLSSRQAAYEIITNKDFSLQPFAQWNSPERIMTNINTMYRNMMGKTGHRRPQEMVALMWNQALLANDLFPQSQPAVMRVTKNNT
jgi:glyoxylase-like metal-dependent hydrolase (beta-lactamase superfamily II)